MNYCYFPANWRGNFKAPKWSNRPPISRANADATDGYGCGFWRFFPVMVVVTSHRPGWMLWTIHSRSSFIFAGFLIRACTAKIRRKLGRLVQITQSRWDDWICPWDTLYARFDARRAEIVFTVFYIKIINLIDYEWPNYIDEFWQNTGNSFRWIFLQVMTFEVHVWYFHEEVVLFHLRKQWYFAITKTFCKRYVFQYGYSPTLVSTSSER